MLLFNSFIAEARGVEQEEINFLTFPKVINPYLGLCKAILFANKKEELYLALHNKIDFGATENKSCSEYIENKKFVQITRPFMLRSHPKNDPRGEFDLINYKKLEDNQELDIQLLELNINWYPIKEVEQLLSPIERGVIEYMNKLLIPPIFSIVEQ